MYNAIERLKLQFATYVILICVVNQCCIAQVEHNTIQDCASSCGNIHNIAYPFRLNTDPKHCGTNKYQLSCENNVLILYLKQHGKQAYGFRVEAINYNNFTIRLKDPNLHLDSCSLPVGNPSLYLYNDLELGDDYLWWSSSSNGYISQDLFFISCEYPMTTSVFQEYNYPCNVTRHWYLMNTTLYSIDNGVDQMENSCRVEATARTSLMPSTSENMSYIDFKNSFDYGFEVSWYWSCCSTPEVSTKYDCSLSSCYYLTKDQRIRKHISNHFHYMFNFLDSVKITPFFSDILTSIKNKLRIYDYWGDLTNRGLVIYFSMAVLAVLVLFRELLILLGSVCVIILLLYKWRRRHQSSYDNVEEFLRSHDNCLTPIRYSYSEIKKFTKSFKEKLGEGGYGSVYKEKLRSGKFAAIKMLDKSKADGQDFINEVATIGRIHHVNVVQLIGYCVEGSKRALVYEFMDNGSLDKHIFSKEGSLSMNNKLIFDISLGVARGIEYLHQGCDMQILHFDIKPHNILLDENFIPNISEFGLAKLYSTDHSTVSLTTARGTLGYIAPEFFYKNIGCISYKADVYSFGMLLMEIVGRRKNINAYTVHSSRIYFPSWIYEQLKEGKEIKLENDIEEGSDVVKKMIIVALWCIQLNPTNRPSMNKVIKMLEGQVEHLKMPPKPFVAPQESPINDVGLNTNPELSSENASSDSLNSISLVID